MDDEIMEYIRIDRKGPGSQHNTGREVDVAAALLRLFFVFLMLLYTTACGGGKQGFVTIPEARPPAGTLETVADMDINPGNVAGARNGRLFASVHPFRRAQYQLIEITGPKNNYKPFPNTFWHREPNDDNHPNVLIACLGVALDSKARLWVIDNGNHPSKAYPPKLVAFDIITGKPVFRYVFDEVTAPPGSFPQDLAVDEENGFVFIADIGGVTGPGIIVVDTIRKDAWRYVGHESFYAEDEDLFVEGRTLDALDPDGTRKPARIGLNPITLSADKETLYYGAMNGLSWYSMPAELLRLTAPPDVLYAKIEKAGPKPVSDGAATDAAGNHYFTNLGGNAITVLSRYGVLMDVARDPRLLWPDNISIGDDGALYIAVNQLHRAPFFNNGEDKGEPPYRIMRLWP